MSTTVLGTAFLNSGRTSICTTVVKVDFGYGVEYRFISVKDSTSLEDDVRMAIQWGSRMDDDVGELLMKNTGFPQNTKYSDIKKNNGSKDRQLNLRSANATRNL